MGADRWLVVVLSVLLGASMGGCRKGPTPARAQAARTGGKAGEADQLGWWNRPSDAQHYVASAECLNCGWEGEVEVPKGVRVHDVRCPACEAAHLWSGTELDALCGTGRTQALLDGARQTPGRPEAWVSEGVKLTATRAGLRADEAQHYEVVVLCLNCGFVGVLPVAKGMPVTSVVCPSCGMWERPPAGDSPGVSSLRSAREVDVMSGARIVRDEVEAALDAARQDE